MALSEDYKLKAKAIRRALYPEGRQLTKEEFNALVVEARALIATLPEDDLDGEVSAAEMAQTFAYIAMARGWRS